MSSVRGLIDLARAQRMHALCERVLGQWRRRDPQTGCAPEGACEATCMRHLNHPDYHQDDRTAFAELMELVADPQVLACTAELLGCEPLFRCTSLFMNPASASREGNWHRDSQFMVPTESEERAWLERAEPAGGVQMQIALVPSEDAEYVPRSQHRFDTPAEYAIRLADGQAHSCSGAMPGAVRVALGPGDAVVFNSLGLHRGRYHVDKPRRTLMLTYSAADKPGFDYFTQQPWFLQPGHLDGLSAQAQAFFQRFIATFAASWPRADAL